jgi:hypothetical protein
MRVLLDECVPKDLLRELPGHAVLTVTQAGWSGTKNGDLLALAETEFDAFITIDRNIEHQQSLSEFELCFIILSVRTNRVADILPLAPEILSALSRAKKRTVIRVPGDTSTA